MRVFENRILSKLFGTERDEVKGEWRTLYNEEFFLSLLLTKYQVKNN